MFIKCNWGIYGRWQLGRRKLGFENNIENKENERKKKDIMLLLRGILYCIIIVVFKKKGGKIFTIYKKGANLERVKKNYIKHKMLLRNVFSWINFLIA